VGDLVPDEFGFVYTFVAALVANNFALFVQITIVTDNQSVCAELNFADFAKVAKMR
jgi:hypothetical protein